VEDRIETPQNQRSRDTRAALLDAAWRLLEGSGGSAVTMAAVAREAGVSRRGLYLHFPSRGQLFLGLLDHVDDVMDLQSSLRPLYEAPDALAALDAFADHVADYHSRLIPVARAVDRCRHDDEDAALLWDRATGAWLAGCRGLSERLAAEGRLADPWTEETAADLLWALMSVELVDDLTGDRGWSVEQTADRLRVLVHRTLCGAER
jgi:AcrR family transcriptional regulator